MQTNITNNIFQIFITNNKKILYINIKPELSNSVFIDFSNENINKNIKFCKFITKYYKN